MPPEIGIADLIYERTIQEVQLEEDRRFISLMESSAEVPTRDPTLELQQMIEENRRQLVLAFSLSPGYIADFRELPPQVVQLQQTLTHLEAMLRAYTLDRTSPRGVLVVGDLDEGSRARLRQEVQQWQMTDVPILPQGVEYRTHYSNSSDTPITPPQVVIDEEQTLSNEALAAIYSRASRSVARLDEIRLPGATKPSTVPERELFKPGRIIDFED
jgi:hypothetical protein